MKTTSFVLSLIVSSLSMFAVVSCNQMPASGSEEAQVEQNSGVIASLDFGSDGKVEFIEVEPGGLLTSATYSSIEAFAPYKDLNPVELYETLSESEAPASLVAAYQQAKAAAKTESNITPPPDFKNDEVIKEDNSQELAKTQMNFNEFAMTYCMGIGECDFGTCVGNATAKTEYSVYAGQMYNYVHSEDGWIRFRSHYWTGSSWFQLNNQWVGPEQTKSNSYIGVTRYIKETVDYAAGKHYHYAFMGYQVAQ